MAFMPELVIRILIGVVAVLFIALSLTLIQPVSDGGRLTRKLCIGNAAGWICILPLSTRGHPPPFLFPALLFWLINLVVLPAAATALWNSHKGREELLPFVAVASTYIAINVMVLFVVPVVLLLYGASR